MSKNVIIGIDLGTSNSCVSIYEGGKATIIPNAEGKRTTPSIVGFTKSGEVVVGDAAKRQAITNPAGTIFSAKRFIGATYADRKVEAGMMPYKVEAGTSGLAVFNINGKTYTPQEISAKVLQKMKQSAEDYLGYSVSQAVITVPAYFGDAQRQATKDAAQIAGLEVLRLVNEPTAASLAYGLDKNKAGKIMVVDIGGGTTDFSVLEISDGVIEVLSTSGDPLLAGDNLDEVLVNHFLETFKSESGLDISKDPMAMQRLKDSAEKAKIELSSSNTTDVNLPFLTADASGPKHLTLTLSRSKFEQLISPLVDKMFIPCHQALGDAKVAAGKIDDVVLVGGTTRIPMIQEKVKSIFGREPNKSVNPDEVVAHGASIQGAVLAGDVTDILLLDVTPLSLGIETVGGVMTKLIDRNTTIPTKKSQVFSTAADGQSAVTIKVMQGERPMASDNMELANFTLSDIPMAPRGTPQIEVSFNINADGIVSVSAKDLGTGKEQNVVITSGTKLSDDEIQKMVKEAELNAEADKARKEMVDARNSLDSMIFSAEKMLKDNKDKVSEDLASELQKELETAKTKLGSESLDEIKTTNDSLQAMIYKISEEIYKNAPKPEEAQATNEPTGE